jgi:hypothetical protein
MKKRLTLVLGLVITVINASAWDEVTHSYLTRLSIQYVRDPELKRFLLKNQDFLLAGCWYPDWEQYTKVSLPGMDNHRRDPFGDACLTYLKREDVPLQPNYQELVAHCLGLFAHVVQDQWYDFILQPYLATRDEGINGDKETGMLNIRLHHMNKEIKTQKYFPVEDLIRIYESYGYLSNNQVSNEYFDSQFHRGTHVQHLYMRGLTALSLFTSKKMQKKMAWASENMMDAPGGFKSCEEATARYWESIFRIILNQPADPVAFCDFDYLEGRINVIASRSTPDEDWKSTDAFLTDKQGNKISAKIFSSPYHSEVVKQFVPEKPLQNGESYTFVLAVKPQFSYSFIYKN